MKEHADNDSLLELPHMADIFEALRRGKHLSPREGDLFRALQRHELLYAALFDKLGFKLVRHIRDFFYFHDNSNFTELSARMAVFVFILVESLADKGDAVEETVLTRRFVYGELPHLHGERYQAYMREAGMTTPDDVIAIVRTMERFGFTRRLDEETFTFQAPVYRFLDLCMEMAAKADDSGTAAVGQCDADEEAAP